MSEPLTAVIRPNGDAMFHRQDCRYAKRARETLLAWAKDFTPGDVWCSICRPDSEQS